MVLLVHNCQVKGWIKRPRSGMLCAKHNFCALTETFLLLITPCHQLALQIIRGQAFEDPRQRWPGEQPAFKSQMYVLKKLNWLWAMWPGVLESQLLPLDVQLSQLEVLWGFRKPQILSAISRWCWFHGQAKNSLERTDCPCISRWCLKQWERLPETR